MKLTRIGIVIAISTLLTSHLVYSGPTEVGASLHQKHELEISDVPTEVINTINKARPGLTITGAEKELKHGNTYIDVETLDKEGNEIEFDMLLDNGAWKIAEIQRDLAFTDTPDAVQAEFTTKLAKLVPVRIIESDQGDGTIIYEFFTISEKKLESKHEIKFAQGKAQLLKDEWQH